MKLKLSLALFSIFALLSVAPAFADIDTGLVSYWKFDEGSGIIATDSADGNNGTLYNFTDYAWVSGKFGSALNFTGNSTHPFGENYQVYVDVGNNSNMAFGAGDFSIALWVKLPVTTSQTDLLGHIDFEDVSNGWYLYINNYSVGFAVDNGTAREMFYPPYLELGNVNVSTDTWRHIVAVKTETAGFLYVDGIQKLNVTNESYDFYQDNLIPTVFGCSAYGSPSYEYPYCQYNLDIQSKSMDEIRVYNRSLSDSDVLELYNYAPSTTTTTVLTTTTTTTAPPVTGPMESTLSDIGAGIGQLFSGISAPIAIFIILLGIGAMVGVIISGLGKRIGGKV